MRHSLLTIVIVLVITMGLSSCLCQPRYASFLNLVEKNGTIKIFLSLATTFPLKNQNAATRFV